MKKKKKQNSGKKAFSSLENKPSGAFHLKNNILPKINLLDFFVQTLLNVFLLKIGLAVPGFFITRLLFKLNLMTFEPEFIHIALFTLCSVPVGALVYLLGVRDGGKWFGKLMLNLFIFGFVLSLISGALSAFVIQWLIAPIFGLALVELSNWAHLFFSVLLICYGIYATFQDEPAVGNSYQAATGTGISPETDDWFSDSSGDSDSGGSDGGGDGGD